MADKADNIAALYAIMQLLERFAAILLRLIEARIREHLKLRIFAMQIVKDELCTCVSLRKDATCMKNNR